MNNGTAKGCLQPGWILASVLSLWLLSCPIYAQTQTTGAIQGTVYEIGTNLPIGSAVVLVTHEGKGYARSTLTALDGTYFMANLESGYYTITASHSDFESDVNSTTNGFAVRITKTGLVVPPPIGLRRKGAPPPPAPVPVSASDTDSRDEQLVNTVNATRGGNFDRRQLSALPLGGFRSFDELALLLPGVAPPPQPVGETLGPGIGAGVGTSGQLVVNGLPSRSNNFTMDGSDNNDEDVGVRRQGFTALVPQSIESLQEFQATTLLAEPQYGRNLGAQVNAVSRGGTRQLHGMAYGFFTNHHLNARNPFDLVGGPPNYPIAANGRPVMLEQMNLSNEVIDRRQLAPANPVGEENPSTRGQFGFVLGGSFPQTERTFFFAFAQGQQVNASRESHFAVPTVPERGLFGRGDRGLGIGPYVSFPTSEVGDAFFSLFPFPNNPPGPYGANTYSTILPAGGRGIIASLKLDHHFKAFDWEHSLTGRYNFTHDDTTLPVTGEALFSTLRPRTRTQNLSLILNSTLSASLAGQLRFSYGRTHLEFSEVRDPFLLPSSRFPGQPFLLNAPLVQNNSRPGQEPLFRLIPDDTENAPLLQIPILVGDQLVGVQRLGIGSVGQVLVSGFSPLGVDVFNFPQTRTDNTFQYAGTAIHYRRRHKLTAGVDLRRTQLNSNLERNFRPLAVFSGARNLAKDLYPADQAELNRRLGTPTQEAYLGRDLAAVGAPTGFFQTQALVPDATIGLRYWQQNYFISDQVRWLPHWSMTLGLRYELNTVPQEVNRRIESTFADPQVQQLPELVRLLNGRSSIYNSDRNNFAPHIAIAWDPFGRGKTSLRGGYGLYYDQILGAVVSHSRSVFPNFVTLDFAGVNASLLASPQGDPDVLFANGFGFVNPALTAQPRTLSGYQTGLLGSPGDFLLNLGEYFSGNAAGAAGATFFLPADNLVTPFSQHWAFTVEQQWRNDYLLSMAYVGTRGSQLMRFSTPNLGPNAIPVIREVIVTRNIPGFGGEIVAPGFGRPAPSLGSYTLIVSDANSTYHGLQAQLNRRFARGLQFTAAYTWSHAIDEVSDFFRLAGARNIAQSQERPAEERGDANFDIRHRFVFSSIWELPWWKQRRLLGGWQLAAIGTFQGGQPYSIYSFGDDNLDGNFTDRIIPLENGTTIAGAGRNNFRASGTAAVDIAATKKLPIAGRQSVELRAEFFNLFNRTHFGIPVNEVLFPSFGKPVNTRVPGRVIQFALKYSF
jgi:hypothetical protein